MSAESLSYAIDEHDHLIKVDEGYYAFAAENGWCDRFEVDGEWVEVEEAARRLELFNRSELPTLSHGICPDCNAMLLAA
jgi:hypothetical protein